MKDNFPIKYGYFRDRLIKQDLVGEINFGIKGDDDFDDCWMGYSERFNLYWFGNILGDNGEGYDFQTADEILNTKVFKGKSMSELWDKVDFYSIDGLSTFAWVWKQCWDTYYAREKDFAKIAELACELYRDSDYIEMCKKIKKIIASENDLISTLYCYGKMIGFAHCKLCEDYVDTSNTGIVGSLEAIYIRKEYRELNLGTDLMIFCENWVKIKGYDRMITKCESENKVAKKFLKSHQYIKHKKTDLYEKNNIMLGKTVTVTVDRPLGSQHPKYPDTVYPVNYGYVEEFIAPDGEPQDVYILGIDSPLKSFTGDIIAIIHRLNDNEDKWIVAPYYEKFTKDEIIKAVEFQEKYFDSEIITTTA